MLEKAINKTKDISKLIIHSDQGFHYQHSTWTKMENFFGILKQEMYYGVGFKSYDELVNEIERYIKWYNEDRIKTKLNGMSPVMYRLHSA